MINKLTYKQSVAIIYAVALFLDRLDLTIVNITLPTIAKAFKASIVTTDWISMAFLIAMAISIPISSWLGENFGLKKIFVLSLFLFGLGSTLCFIAPTINVLIILRFVQGIGGGMIIPIGMTFIYRLYQKSEYASITSYTFIPALIAPAISPFLGGVLLTAIGWRYVFLFSGPICLIIAIISIFLLRELGTKEITPFDWMGFILSSLFFIVIFITLSMLRQHGINNTSLVYIFVSIPLFVLFILREKNTVYPMINLSHFKNMIFTKANLIQLCFQICHLGGFFLIGMYLQLGAGLSAILTGLIIGMQAIGAMTTSRLSVRLFKYKSERFPIILGFIGVAIISPCVLIIKNQDFLIFGIMLFIIRGAFSGLCGTPIQTLSVIGFGQKDIGKASAVFNISRQVSISLGVAISSLLISFGLKRDANWHIGEKMSFHQAIAIFHDSFIAISIVAIIGAIIAWTIKPKSTLSA